MLSRICAYIAVWSFFTSPTLIRADFTTLVFSFGVLVLFLSGRALLMSDELLRRYKSFCVLSLLLVAPVLPLINLPLLKVLLSSLAAFELVTARREHQRWCLPVLGVCGGVALGGLWNLFLSWNEVSTALSTILGTTSKLYFISTLFPMWQPVVDLAVFFILIGTIVHISNIHALQRSVICGALLGALVTLIQKYGGGEFLLRNQSSFWSGIDRLPGSFTDPNAQGVYLCCALIFGFTPLIRRVRSDTQKQISSLILRYAALCGAILILGYAALLGGSRSFFLGIGIYCILSLFLKKRTIIVPIALLGGGLLLALLLWKYFIPNEQVETYASMLPTGARRILHALSLDRITETFFSRSVFLSMNWEALREYGVWGIGLGRFRYYSPALASAAGYDLGGWVDNSNNFYLGLAAELGILGALVVLSTAVNRRFSPTVMNGGAVVIITLLVLLCTGPHIEAPEVSLLYAAVFGALTSPLPSCDSRCERVQGSSRCLIFALVVICVGGGIAESTREVGVYAWEREGHGMHQWLAPFSRVSKSCGCNGNAVFNLEVARATKEEPVSVSILGAGEVTVHRSFLRPGVHRFSVPCVDSEGASDETQNYLPVQGRAHFTILSGPGWSPKDTGGADSRVLGVRLRDRLAYDLVGHKQCPSSPMGKE